MALEVIVNRVWVVQTNTNYSFHRSPNRNNNTGIVLHSSLRGFRNETESSEVDGKLTGKLCSERISHDPTTTDSGFGPQQCQLHWEKPSLSFHLLIKSSMQRQKHSWSLMKKQIQRRLGLVNTCIHLSL